MKRYTFYLSICLCTLMMSCGKNFLDVKQQSYQVVPQKIADYQALLDRRSTMNGSPSVRLSFVSSDEYTVADGILTSITEEQRNTYLWKPDVFVDIESLDWNNAYERIMYANMALDVEKLKPTTETLDAWNNVKGSALFHRAYGFYQLAQLFCKPYNPETAKSDLGIPLRLDYDLSVKYNRSTVQEVYDQIVEDLREAVDLLPLLGANKFRPSRISACFLLAKTFLHLKNYERAYYYANEALKIKDNLIDFKKLNVNQDYLFTYEYDAGNIDEVIMFYNNVSRPIVLESRMNINPDLLALYDAEDLRRKAYFRVRDTRVIFKGGYSGPSLYFAGFAIDELWLIRAEAQIREGRVKEGMEDIYHLLKHRYADDSYLLIKPSNQNEALFVVYQERQKELVMRGIRWEDLRRWNEDGIFKTNLKRTYLGVSYELPSGDVRWTMPIPNNEVQLNGVQQNLR